MYSYDDRWIFSSHPLMVSEFTSESITLLDCVAVHAEFYHNKLRTLIIRGHETPSVESPEYESFVIQHGDPLPNTMYLGVARQHCHTNRFFRIVSIHAEFPHADYPRGSLSQWTYKLAGLPGEGDGLLDCILNEIENE